MIFILLFRVRPHLSHIAAGPHPAAVALRLRASQRLNAVTRRPPHSTPSTRHDSTGWSSSRTAHAPHSPSSQPCFVPHRFRSSRSTSRSVLYGAKAISVASRLTVSVMCAFGIFRLATRGFRSVGGALRAAQSRNREGGDLFGDGGRTLRTVGTEP